MVYIQTLDNGQRIATKDNLILVQTIIDGERFNDCSIKHDDHIELVSTWDDRFREIHIALAQY